MASKLFIVIFVIKCQTNLVHVLHVDFQEVNVWSEITMTINNQCGHLPFHHHHDHADY